MEQYLQRIRAILDQASGDNDLSTADYAELCHQVADDAQGRADAADIDVQQQQE